MFHQDERAFCSQGGSAPAFPGFRQASDKLCCSIKVSEGGGGAGSTRARGQGDVRISPAEDEQSNVVLGAPPRSGMVPLFHVLLAQTAAATSPSTHRLAVVAHVAAPGWACQKSYLLMRRMVNRVPADTEKAMAADGAAMPSGVYLESKHKREKVM